MSEITRGTQLAKVENMISQDDDRPAIGFGLTAFIKIAIQTQPAKRR
jgi:hypothetical protein